MASLILFPYAIFPTISIYDLESDEEDIQEIPSQSENQIFGYNPTTNQAFLVQEEEEEQSEVAYSIADSSVSHPAIFDFSVPVLEYSHPVVLEYSHPMAYELPDQMYEEEQTQEVNLEVDPYEGDTQPFMDSQCFVE